MVGNGVVTRGFESLRPGVTTGVDWTILSQALAPRVGRESTGSRLTAGWSNGARAWEQLE